MDNDQVRAEFLEALREFRSRFPMVAIICYTPDHWGFDWYSDQALEFVQAAMNLHQPQDPLMMQEYIKEQDDPFKE